VACGRDDVITKPAESDIFISLQFNCITNDGLRWLTREHPSKARTKVTQEVKARLQAELDELESELRVHLPKEIKRALEFGDLRENAEYRAALDRQNIVKARIRELRQRISEVGSIDISKIPHDRAGYGSTLLLYDSERGEEVTYRLVTPEESDPQAGLISTMSPVGKSLLGKEEGDEVTVRTPAGARNFEIKRLTTIHDEKK
jgi:transcription elongation factor GreA